MQLIRSFSKAALSFALAFSLTLPATSIAFAAESYPAVTSAPSANAEVGKASEDLALVYITSPSVAAGDKQEVAVVLSDSDADISEATLTIKHGWTGNVKTIKAEQLSNNGAIFYFDTTSFATGDWQLVELASTTQNGISKTELLTCDPNTFTVTTSKPAGEQSVSTDAYFVDSQGNLEQSASVEDAISDAVSTSAKTRGNNGGETTFSLMATGTVVVGIDPGHGGDEPGSFGVGGVAEKDLNWKIANYCKSELEKYEGVRVVMSRAENQTEKKLDVRVQTLKNAGARVVVSIHLNAFNTAAYGAEVYAPNQYGNLTIHNDGTSLARAIATELGKLGLTLRGSQGGVQYRTDTDKSDYYGMIRYAKQAGLPGIIVEHCFIDNQSDYSKYLSDENKLRNLGVADAVGIANYFGLTKLNWHPSVSASTQTPGTYRVSVDGFNTPASVSAVHIPVWSAAGPNNGQDDIVWYPATKSGTNWIVDVPIAKHRDAGTYNAHAYATLRDGSLYYINGTSFNVSGPSATMTAQKSDTQGTITYTAHVRATNGISNVLLPTWCSSVGDQDDIVWYPMNKQSGSDTDATYTLTVNMANHKYQVGSYEAHLYVTDGASIMACPATASTSMSLPPVHFVAEQVGNSYTQKVSISGGMLANATAVTFPTWSEAGGQDDLVWYGATKDANGVWTTTINATTHRTAGDYAVHAYATIGGTLTYAGATSFNVAGPSATLTTEKNENNGTIVYTAHVRATNGIASVLLPTWCSTVGDQDDIKWYEMFRQSGTDTEATYTLTVNMANHKYQVGSYEGHLYVTDRANIMACASTSSTSMALPPTNYKVEQVGNAFTFEATISGGVLANATSVVFPTWSAEGGQDDLVWYSAKKNDFGVWAVTISASNHKSAGDYYVHCYATIEGSLAYIGDKTFNIAGPSATMTADKNETEGTITYTARIQATNGMASVLLPTWCSSVGDQDDIVWYPMNKQSGSDTDATYTLTVNMANHKYQVGNYEAHLYITDRANLMVNAQMNTTAMVLPPTNLKIGGSNTDTSRSVSLSGGMLAAATSVLFPTWSDAGGQDDIVWYEAHKNASGVWTTTIPLTNHKQIGTYSVHGYATIDGTFMFVKDASFTVDSSIITLLGYSIMGVTTASVDQMVRAFDDSAGHAYPADYLASKGAASARDFFTILVEEANLEGIKAEVLFAQVIVETGWLGSTFAKERCNFGGLGAVDSNPSAANTFPDVRTGLRAQVQHLRAYADPNVTKGKLHSECVDVRFDLVKPVGKTQLVEHLGNGNWASDPQYASKLMILIAKVRGY